MITDSEAIFGLIKEWEGISALAGTDAAATAARAKELTGSCPLCSRYENAPRKREGGRVVAELRCRKCPIVRVTGRTCAHARNAEGYPEDWIERPERQQEGIRIVLRTLRRVQAGLDG